MNTLSRFGVGLVLALAAGAAQADPGPRMVGGGDDTQIVYDAGPHGNVVGGGRTLIATGFGGPYPIHQDAMPANPAGFATMSGGGEDMTLGYAPGPSAKSVLASRR